MIDLAPQGQPEAVLLKVGDIVISHTFVVTPSGTCRLDEARIDSIVQTKARRRTPTWAQVVAIMFIFTIVSLLFLFVREDYTSGQILVVIDGPGFSHTAKVRVRSEGQIAAAQRDVAQVEGLIEKARLR